MHLFLDVDGTLVDTNYLHVDAWARAFHALGLVIPRAAIHRQIGKGSDQMLPLFVAEPDRARASQLHEEEYGRLAQFGFALPGARELLLKMHAEGHALWLGTSAQPQELAGRLDALRVERSIFAGIVSSGDVARSKPHPDIFEALRSRAGCRAEEALVLGDTLWDVLAAKGAGVRSVAVLSGGAFARAELLEGGAVAVFDDCAALVASAFPHPLAP